MKKTYEAPVLATRGSAVAQTLQFGPVTANEPSTGIFDFDRDNS